MAGTGSEINAGSVITNWERISRVPFIRALAKVAIIDPQILSSTAESDKGRRI